MIERRERGKHGSTEVGAEGPYRYTTTRAHSLTPHLSSSLSRACFPHLNRQVSASDAKTYLAKSIAFRYSQAPKKGVSKDEKLRRLLAIFHDTRDVFVLNPKGGSKDIQRLASAHGIISNAVPVWLPHLVPLLLLCQHTIPSIMTRLVPSILPSHKTSIRQIILFRNLAYSFLNKLPHFDGYHTSLLLSPTLAPTLPHSVIVFLIFCRTSLRSSLEKILCMREKLVCLPSTGLFPARHARRSRPRSESCTRLRHLNESSTKLCELNWKS